MEAAQHWATVFTSARGGKDEAPDEMRRLGSSEEEIRAALGDDRQEDFGIWPENVATVEMFMSLQTQWRIGPMGGYLGLEYPGVQAAMRMRRVRKPATMFASLQVMERAALPVLNKAP